MLNNLKNRYEEKEMKVSVDLWEKLEEQLDNEVIELKKKPVTWYRYAAAIVLFFGLGSVVWVNINEEEKVYPQFVNNEKRVLPEISTEIIKKEKSDGFTTEFVEKETRGFSKSNVLEKEIADVVPKLEENKELPENKERLVENVPQEKTEPKKYISSSDLLFGVEMDKVKTQKSNSAIGVHSYKKNDDEPNLLKPKEIKIFGYSIYKKDSITTK